MANLNAQEAYVLELLKEISGLRNQIDTLNTEIQAVRECSDENDEAYHKAVKNFNSLKSYAKDFKAEVERLSAENRELAKENQALTTELDR